jgi:hypothetical protein
MKTDVGVRLEGSEPIVLLFLRRFLYYYQQCSSC